MKLLKKYSVKIPKNIKIIYLAEKKLITVIGPLSTKSLKLNLHLVVDKSNNYIYITKELNTLLSRKFNKNLESIQGTTTALLKQCILEVVTTSYKKLEIVGVGYRVSNIDSILHFKLGFSHSIYLKVNSNLKIISSKYTNLHIFGNSYFLVTQFASFIRSYKVPEVYKGKGILYQNEKIKLKEGKKV